MQQFLIVNVDKSEYLDPHAFGDGRKLREFGRIIGVTLAALSWLLIDHNESDTPEHPVAGRWCGDRIIVAGNKAPGGEHLPEKWLRTWREKQAQGTEFGDKPNLYTYALACCMDISPAAGHLLAQEPALCSESQTTGRELSAFVDSELSAEIRALLRGEEYCSSVLQADDTSMFQLSESDKE
jgi:hypothetical protein